MLNIPRGDVTALLAHPDDIKSVTGNLLMAMERGAKASLILVTKGEAMDLSVNPLKMGKARIKELRGFLKDLGIPESRFFQMGVPNGSSALAAMREDFFEARGEPFWNDLLDTNRVPYKDAHKPGMPFFGQTLAKELGSLLRKLKPAVVFTHHPRDAHADHRAVSFFARKACAAMKGSRAPRLFAVLVYAQGMPWPPRGRSFYTKALERKYPGLKPRRIILPSRIYRAKRRLCRHFYPILGKAYINGNMKRDEMLWRLGPAKSS